MTRYWIADEVGEIAEKLIAKHHPHLDNVTIKYVFRDKGARAKGRPVLGKARKIGGLNAHLVKLVGRNRVDGEVDFFVIEIAHDAWVLADQAQREALVDHELCHLDIEEINEEDRRLVLHGHDLEEFVEVVERHGMWRQPIEALVNAAGQTTIDDQLGEDVLAAERARHEHREAQEPATAPSPNEAFGEAAPGVGGTLMEGDQ